MTIVLHHYAHALLEPASQPRSSASRHGIISAAKQIAHPRGRWINVDIRSLMSNAQEKGDAECDLEELEEWIHWDGSRPLDETRDSQLEDSKDMSAEADTGFLEDEVEHEEEEKEPSGTSYFNSGPSTKHSDITQPRSHAFSDEIVPDSESDSDNERASSRIPAATSYRLSGRSQNTLGGRHSTFRLSQQVPISVSQSRREAEEEVVQDSLILEDSRTDEEDDAEMEDMLIPDGPASDASEEIFPVSFFPGSISREYRRDSDEPLLHHDISSPVKHGAVDASVDFIDASAGDTIDEASFDLQDANIEMGDPKDSALHAALSRNSSPPHPPTHEPAVIPQIIVPPPRLQSTSPKKTRTKRPIVFPKPTRVVSAVLSPVRPRSSQPNSQLESQDISEILDPDEFTIEEISVKVKKQKLDPQGEWGGDQISEWHAQNPQVHVVPESNDGEHMQDDLSYDEAKEQRSTETSVTLLRLIPLPHINPTPSISHSSPPHKARWEASYSPNVSDETNPDMRYLWINVGIVIEHPFVTIPLWNKLLQLREKLRIGVALCPHDEYEGGAFIKVYVEAPMRLEVRRRIREWEKTIGNGKRIIMRLVGPDGLDLDEPGWA